MMEEATERGSGVSREKTGSVIETVWNWRRGDMCMDNRNRKDHDIIEDLIVLLEYFQEDGDNLDYIRQSRAGLAWDERELELARCMKRFVDRMPGGFFVYHADGNEEIIYANEAMVRLFCCDSMAEFRKLTGNSFRGIVHPEDLEAVEESIRQQIADSSYDLDYVEYRIVTKDGDIRWIDDYGHFIHGDTVGDVFYVFAGDATEKKKRLMEEKESFLEEKRQKEWAFQSKLEEYGQILEKNRQEQFRRLEVIEGLGTDYESIFYADLKKGRIKAYRVSSRFKEQFPERDSVRDFRGFDSDYIRDWVYTDDREELAGVSDPEYIRRKLSGDKMFYRNYRIYRDGKTSYMQLCVVDVGEEEEVSQVVFGYRNMDHEVERERNQKRLLMETLHEANLANNAKNLFLSNMSHDIRTPMNAIMGFTALARNNLDDREKAAEYLDMISTAGNQLLQLLNDVLEISKIESAQIRMEESECSLIDLIQQIQKAVFFRAAEKKITLSLDITHLCHDIVSADREKLTQILSYLVDNALKYTKENGRVTIAVAEQEALKDHYIAYEFVVEDNGIGISEEFLEHIFDPFEREKNTTFSGIHGTGLGLTITKKLVDMMGGNIYVTSTVGEGSKFVVSLPLRLPETGQESQKEETSVLKQTDQRRILLVDDNEINLEIEAEMLKGAGFVVETAEDGKVALEKITKSPPGRYHLILMDIQMPVMDGYQATRAIRQIPDPELAKIPIIAVSANAFEEDRRKALECGMNAHLPKPLDMEQLFGLMEKFL